MVTSETTNYLLKDKYVVKCFAALEESFNTPVE